MSSMRYIDEFLSLNCAPHLLKLKYFPNSKEVTESMAMYSAYRTYFGKTIKSDDDKVLCIVVGDGKYPRTGALFAMRTKWNIVSIDPASAYNPEDAINRLKVYKNKVEKINLDEEWDTVIKNASYVIIILPHSHAAIEHCERFVRDVYFNEKNYVCIAMPCCFKQDTFLYRQPNFEFVDDAVNSEKNLIKIFTNVETGE